MAVRSQGQAVTSRVTIAIGIMLLAVSVATSRTDYLLVNWGAFLAGSILVIVGTGRMFFLEK
jgi:hypothetical protein